MAAILVVDDEAGIREYMCDALQDAGHEVEQAVDGQDAARRLELKPFDLLLSDLRMPGKPDGMELVRRARAEWPEMQIVVLTAHGTIENAVEAMRLGAFDFIEKPVAAPTELRRIAARALNWRRSRQPASVGASDGAAGIDAATRGATDATASVAPGSSPSHGRGGVRGALRNVLWQLKRRHVYNVAATYAAGAFVLLQCAELMLPVLPLPPLMYRVLVALVIAGFPFALVAGWVWDITATGLQRTSAPRAEYQG